MTFPLESTLRAPHYRPEAWAAAGAPFLALIHRMFVAVVLDDF
jgi:hypothetical protein